MSYKIIVDSCGELTDEMKVSGYFETASLEIDVAGHHLIDDETFNQAQFLKYVKESPECPKSSCPSPEKYMEKYRCEAEHVYAVTLSAELSGSYNSAQLGRNLYFEEYGKKDIYVFNSRSASIGETLIALKIQECEEKGMPFYEVVEQVEADKEIQDYAQAYAEMKPKQAASIFETMTDDLDLAAKILDQMSAEDRGNILGSMDPEIASRLTKIMDPDS